MKRALYANALFSGLSGAVFAVGAGPLSRMLGPPGPAFILVGVGLLVFAAILVWIARAPDATRVRASVAADAAWVLASLAVLLADVPWLTPLGRAEVAAIAAIVAALAAWQYHGARKATIPPPQA